MARSRAGEVLEGWKLVTRQAAKAERAPRRSAERPLLPIGFAVAAIALVLAAGFSFRSVSLVPQPTSPPPAACGAAPAGASAGCTEPPTACGSAPAGASLACTSPAHTGAPGGLSQEEAIVAALRHAPSSSSTPIVIGASIGNDPFAAGSSNQRPVWAVRLEAPFKASPCPSGFLERMPSTSDPACLDAHSGLIVVIDYFTGDLIGWLH